jgi:hypothetical protein
MGENITVEPLLSIAGTDNYLQRSPAPGRAADRSVREAKKVGKLFTNWLRPAVSESRL